MRNGAPFPVMALNYPDIDHTHALLGLLSIHGRKAGRWCASQESIPVPLHFR
ncbi:hypothetical protein [Paenibacillus sp. GCM10027629]|uniref:hypothetical protein n=1 Tax=Paenibacillus sp. GCM10027629 TaxID=3273414 RepID=UPI0036D3B9AC